ncbi:hypothetical protein [Ferdinandcohnia sp. Marseille-Q9671]
MSCCSPEYRKVVQDQEEKVNQHTKDTLPKWAKVASILILVGATTIFFLL